VQRQWAAKRVTVMVGETDREDGHALYQALVRMLHDQGIAGVSVVRGIMGYGASGHLHASHLLDVSEDLPIAVVFIDTAEKVESVLPRIAEMVETGLATVEDVQAITYSRG
jgi:PII-like signaling protein